LGARLDERAHRDAFQKNKDDLSKKYGLICFSSKWDNPVMWSHYADRHKGVCVGFDVPDDQLFKVQYRRERLAAFPVMGEGTQEQKMEFMKAFLATKFAHWRYESEYRLFTTLEEPEGTLYFSKFSETFRPQTVIVGACSALSRKEISEALGEREAGASCFKARLAFKTFRVVRNRDNALWQ
jgi:Protein of unknown function (DUF2971)